MSMHVCDKHGLMSPVQCDNFLDSGLRCPNSSCGDCWDYCEKMDVPRPSADILFCYSCVKSITSRIHNITNELYVDLTLNESDSGDSHLMTMMMKRSALILFHRLIHLAEDFSILQLVMLNFKMKRTI